MPTKIDLVTIDPQKDFHPGGALPVTGADQDAERLAKMVKTHGHKLNDWHITLDMHNRIDVGHPLMWKDKKGQNPPPFTMISNVDLKAKTWQPVWEPWSGYFLDYTEKLEAKGRYSLMVWPEHCLIGHPGAALYPVILETMLFWEKENSAIADKVTKGQNPLTEHYSALVAEVPFTGNPALKIAGDPATQLNSKFVNTLKNADLVLFSGQALSHCVKYTFLDTLDAFGLDNAKKLVILEDCSSPVSGFETQAQEFLEDVRKKGVMVTNSEKFWRM